MLSADALDGVSEIEDNFGAEDKLLPCQGNLVFIDLDRQWFVSFDHHRAL